MDAYEFDLATRSTLSDPAQSGWWRKHAVALAVVATLAGLGGCARDGGLDTLPPAPAAGFAPADGPTPTSTLPRPTTTTSPLRTTTWTVAPPRLSTEPRRHAPGTTVPDDGDLTNDTLVVPGGEMTFDAIRALIDPHGESPDMVALAWGDVDGDGDIDAIVLTTWCGASCGKQLDLVLNNNGTPTLYAVTGENAFEPWFIPAGAGQSFELSATITPSNQFLGSMITLTGRYLCGEDPLSIGVDGGCDEDLLRTATYVFHDGTLSPSAIDPPLSLTPTGIQQVLDPDFQASSFEVLAWGDIDRDGDADAVVLTEWCDASCGTRLDLVLATETGPIRYVRDGGVETFAPYYNGGGAQQSSVTSATIDNSQETYDLLEGSLIQLTGERLCDPDGGTLWTDCGLTQRAFLFDDQGRLWPLDQGG